MTAIAWNRSSTTGDGIRPFDARHHLRQVAELISSVFADELDASGRGALQEMQLVSKLSPVLGGLLSSAFFNDFVLGYVWVESGRIVGNVTFQRVDVGGARWRISNVAVSPDQRRRGIARALMIATLREIALRGGSWAVLQVRVDNPAARRLYEGLRFTDVCRDGVWQWEPSSRDLAAVQIPESPVRLQPLSLGDWQSRLELARYARPPLANWADPIQASAFQPGFGRLLGEAIGRLRGLPSMTRWGARQGGGLIAAVETMASSTSEPHRMRFDVHPEFRGQMEAVLVARGLSDLAFHPIRSITVDHSGDDTEGVAALEAHGFRPQRVLLTMRRLMTPSDADL